MLSVFLSLCWNCVNWRVLRWGKIPLLNSWNCAQSVKGNFVWCKNKLIKKTSYFWMKIHQNFNLIFFQIVDLCLAYFPRPREIAIFIGCDGFLMQLLCARVVNVAHMLWTRSQSLVRLDTTASHNEEISFYYDDKTFLRHIMFETGVCCDLRFS